MPRFRQRLALHALTLAFLGFGAPLVAQADDCPIPGEWRLDSGETLPSAALFAELAERQVVLLGERHDRLSHHRWQLHTLSGLHAHRPDMVSRKPVSNSTAQTRRKSGKLPISNFSFTAHTIRGWGKYAIVL
ncbi:ChaN family lipoprotein [Aquilutibacter rugosus]|uniref:ChaN family lipoprotein n=1 Tax=Aquilutibacter rugosus TaxID=3115820 RepID=UPI002F417C44